jgi:hypothetical protein
MTEMQAIDVFVFGHYDSRGGTAAIAAANMQEAAILYVLMFSGGDAGSYDDELLKSYWDGMLKEDWMFNATLFMPEDVQLAKGKIEDLENGDGGEDKGGYVLTQGDETDWAKLSNVVGDMPVGTKHQILEFVPEGRRPQVLKSWDHPRWDDDAFSFCLVNADSYAPEEVTKLTEMVNRLGLEAK